MTKKTVLYFIIKNSVMVPVSLLWQAVRGKNANIKNLYQKAACRDSVHPTGNNCWLLQTRKMTYCNLCFIIKVKYSSKKKTLIMDKIITIRSYRLDPTHKIPFCPGCTKTKTCKCFFYKMFKCNFCVVILRSHKLSYSSAEN